MQAAIYDLETSGGVDIFSKKQKTSQNTAGLRVLDRVCQVLEDYITENGGSVFDCFQVIDAGDDNYIQPAEFLSAMKNLGAKDMTLSEVKLMFQVVDENNDGALSYGEFSKYVGSIHGNKKIDNADHVLFVVADQIRRIMRAKNGGIANMLGTKNNQISWDTFLDKLEAKNIFMKPKEIDALSELLDCKDNKDMVDLKVFQDLIGIHVDVTQTNRNTLKAHKEMVKSAAIYSELRTLKRNIFKPLIDEQVSADKLELDFNASSKLDKKNPIISLKLFTEIIVGSYATGKLMEGDISKLGGYYKDEKNPLMMNVKKFLESYNSFCQIFNIETYLFGQIENIQHKKKLQSIEGLFQRDSKDEYLSAQDFGQALLKIHVRLDEDEVNILVMEFDPTGEASLLHIKLFVEEYDDWHAGEHGLKELKENKKVMQEQLRKPIKGAPAPAPKTAAAAPAKDDKPDSKILGGIITRITQDYAANNFNLSSMFSTHKTPQVTLNQFLDEIMDSLKSMKLTRDEQDLLANAYKTAKFSEKYDYSLFKQDIRKESTKSTNITERILDEEERKMIEQIKEYVEKKNLSSQLTIEFKKKDTMDKKTLTLVDMQNCIKAIGLTLGTKQFDLLFKILKPNNESKFSYLELLILIVGQFAAQQLCNATILELEQSTKQSKVTFLPPASIQQAVTARMGSIGELIRLTQQNYEEAFIRETGDVNRVKPQITEEIIYKVLGKLTVKLDSQQNFELKQYLSERAQGPQKSINLVQLLTDVGLPPQTLGAEAVKTGEPNKVLGEDIKARCQNILIEIGRSMPKQQGKKPEDFFEQDKNGQIKAEDFMYILKKMKSVAEILTKLKVEQNLPNLVIYLSEANQNLISHKKLGEALKASEKDLPLLQYNTKDLMDYKASLKKSATETAAPIKTNIAQEFVAWMVKNDYTLKDLFPGADLKTVSQIPFGDFQKEIKYKNFKSSDEMELLRSLDKTKSNKSIDITYLKELLTKAQSKVKTNTSNVLLNFPPKVKAILDKIEQSMAKQNLNPETLHSYLDENGDGEVDKKEFVSRLGEAINQRGLISADIGLVFDTLDRNDDGKISLNEFKTFIKGVAKSKEKRMTEIDDNIMKQIRDQISDLFEHFDLNGDGEISSEEIKKTLESFGLKRTIENCKEMIQSTNGGNGDKLNRKQFGDVLIPIMQDQLLSQEDNVEDLRKVFLEADVDYSGYLSVSELWAALKKKGADVTLDDVCELMAEIDIDRDGHLDIDEFISLMSLGDQLPIAGKGAKSTYQKMQQSRKMNPVDFVKAFKNMPTNFVTSFMDEQWTCGRLNLPSSAFKAQIDPKTMLWKDVRQVNTEDLRTVDKNFKPKLRPMDSSIGCLISFDKAEGVPLPQIGNGQAAFKDEFIVKRAIRICVDIKCGQTRTLVHNSIQVPADWNKDKEDMWSFDTSDSSLRNVLFRTTDFDQLEVKEGRILFELVVYVRSTEESNITEMSCGWCELPLEALKSKQSGKSLNIIGGSPFAEVDIKQEDIRAKRTGLAAVQKAFTGVQKRIVIDITPLTGLKPQELKSHMTLLPSTCFVHQSLLYFVTGFMNYKAEKLLREMSAGQFRKPGGDVVISSFPKIYDNPDIVEELTKCWYELAMPEINKAGLNNCDFITEKTVLFCQKLYPVLFSEEFMTIEHTGTTKSGAGSKNSNQEDMAVARKALVSSALRAGEKNSRKEIKSTSELTTFKPFSIRELEFDVWDCTRSKKDKFINSIKTGAHEAQHISKQVTFQDN